jgi:hypothetical protein
MTAAAGQAVIEQWLEAKAAANGGDRDLTQLQEILTGTILLERQEAAQALQQAGEVRTYRHEVMDVEVAAPDPQTPDQAQVEATVMEAVDGGAGERLRLRYDMVRQDGNWLIQDITVLGSGVAAPVEPEAQSSSPDDQPDVAPAADGAPTSGAPIEPTGTPTDSDVVIPETTAPDDAAPVGSGED